VRRAVSVSGLACFLSSVAPASAAPAPAAVPASAPAGKAPAQLADSLGADAKLDYASGRLLYADGDFQGALVKFRGAYDKSKDARLLWNIAACEKNLRHYASVLRLHRQYQHDGAGVLTASDQAEAAELVATIEPLTAALAVKVNEPGAEIFVDDVLVGESPLDRPVIVDIGVRRVRVHKAEWTETTKEIPVGGSPTLAIDVKLEKIVHQGHLVVTAGAKDAIALDGKTVATGQWTGALPSGGHLLRVTAPDMRPYQSDVIISDNDTRTLTIALDREIKSSGGVPAWVWLGGGALVVGGLALGSYALFRTADRTATLPAGTLEPGAVQASFPVFR
jgi:hypothetical protein